MKMSVQGAKFLSLMEGGMVLVVYDDGFGYPTGGLGHVITDRDGGLCVGDPIEPEVAWVWLREDLKTAEDAIRSIFYDTLNQYEFDALVCFVFNIGVTAFRNSTLVRRMVCGEDKCRVVREELPRWRKAGGRVVKALEERRQEVVELFCLGDYVRDWDGLGKTKLSEV